MMRSAALGPVIIAGVVLYFAYHAMTGENGFSARAELESQRDTLRRTLLRVSAQKEVLSARADWLDRANPDLDYIEARAKALSGLAHRDEWVVHLHQP